MLFGKRIITKLLARAMPFLISSHHDCEGGIASQSNHTCCASWISISRNLRVNSLSNREYELKTSDIVAQILPGIRVAMCATFRQRQTSPSTNTLTQIAILSH